MSTTYSVKFSTGKELNIYVDQDNYTITTQNLGNTKLLLTSYEFDSICELLIHVRERAPVEVNYEEGEEPFQH